MAETHSTDSNHILLICFTDFDIFVNALAIWKGSRVFTDSDLSAVQQNYRFCSSGITSGYRFAPMYLSHYYRFQSIEKAQKPTKYKGFPSMTGLICDSAIRRISGRIPPKFHRTKLRPLGFHSESEKTPRFLSKSRSFLVRVARLELTASWPPVKRATNCATPGCLTA